MDLTLSQMSIKTIFLFSLLSLAQFVVAQERNYSHYQISDGLPSYMLFAIHIDGKGQVWVGSNYGVTCFNGSTFKTYTVDDGLSDNTVLKISEDSKGRIWFYHVDKLPSYFENDKVKKLNSPLPQFRIDESSFLIELDGGSMILGGVGGLIQIDPLNNVIYHQFPNIKERITTLFRENNNLFIKTYANDNDIFNPLERLGYQIQNISEIEKVNTFMNELDITYGAINRSFPIVLDLLDDTFKDANFDSVIEALNKTLIYCVLYSDNRLYISTDNGVFIFDYLENKLELKEHLLEGDQVGYVQLDEFNNLWVSTLNNGLFLFPNSTSKLFASPTNRILGGLIPWNEGVLAGSKYGDLMYFKGDGVEDIDAIGPGIKEMISLEDTILIIFHSGIMEWTPESEKQTSYVTIINQGDSCQTLMSETDSLIPLSTVQGTMIYNYSRKTIFPAFKNSYKLGRIHQTLIIGDWVLMACNQGLFVIPKSKFGQTVEPIRLFDRVNDMLLQNGRLILATENKGLIVVQPNEPTLYYTEKTKMLSNNTRLLCNSKDSGFWVAGQNGVQRFKFVGNNLIQMQTIDTKTELKINSFSCIMEHEEKLYFSTERGVYCEDLKDDSIKAKLPLFFGDITTNGIPQNFKDEIDLSYEQNDIKVSLDAINFTTHQTNYYHRINNNRWQKSIQNEIFFPSLAPGDYLFEFYADSPFFEQSDIMQFSVHISEPWWYNWFLIIGLILILCLVFFALIKWRASVKTEEKRLALKLELQALQGQINPHFIFNSLNSINKFIGENDTRSTQIYLAEFAQLFRQMLDQSGTHITSVATEVAFLSNYLKLEQLRANHQFDFTFTIDDKLKAQTMGIPSFLLQPLVENSIWHSMMTNEKQGILNISFKKIGENIVCAISDNGIGFDKTIKGNEKDQTKHNSNGLRLTNDRIKLFEKKYKVTIELNITANKRKDGSDGTLVTIVLPQINI
ncbi:MAG: putative pyridoxamine 5'-phosphate oxidase family protein [Crocinitomix sp.]|jgi:uncharacterized pyridoxamine 5'-phosphate oxidase family protein